MTWIYNVIPCKNIKEILGGYPTIISAGNSMRLAFCLMIAGNVPVLSIWCNLALLCHLFSNIRVELRPKLYSFYVVIFFYFAIQHQQSYSTPIFYRFASYNNYCKENKEISCCVEILKNTNDYCFLYWYHGQYLIHNESNVC